MAKYRQKPIEAITFDEFVEYGRSNGKPIYDGMCWSFEYNGCSVTNENKECYLICNRHVMFAFTPQDMLITDFNGEVYPIKIDRFKKLYEKIEEE